MPAKSKAQQQAMAIAYASKKSGKTPTREPSKSIAKSMSKSQLKDFAKTDTKSLPDKVADYKLEDMSDLDLSYLEGVISKFAEYGIDPELFLKHNQA